MTEVTKTRETRVNFTGAPASFGIEFKLPGGEVVKIEDHTTLPGATITTALQYGMRRLYQDRLAGDIKEGANADGAARAIIDKFTSGDWSATRSSDGRPTMQGVAAAIVRNAKKGIKGDDLKAAVTRVLDSEGNPKGFAVVKAAFDERLAQWEAAQAKAKATADDLGL